MVCSLSAADEWNAMTHRIDAESPAATRAPQTVARLRDACLLALQRTYWTIFIMNVINK